MFHSLSHPRIVLFSLDEDEIFFFVSFKCSSRANLASKFNVVSSPTRVGARFDGGRVARLVPPLTIY